MSRLLRVLLAACLLALVPGCGSDTRDPLVVLGPWTGEEGRAFEAALDKLDDGTGRTYTYEGTRSLRETLVSQLEADARRTWRSSTASANSPNTPAATS